MRELIESIFRFSWAMTLTGVQQVVDILVPRHGGEAPATPGTPVPSPAPSGPPQAPQNPVSSPLRPAQVPMSSNAPGGPPLTTTPASVGNPPAAVHSGRLNTSRMVV